MTFYKIRHKETGFFSIGGQNPRFTVKGKTWNDIGHIKTHINLHTGAAYYGRGRVNHNYLNNIEVVEYTLRGTHCQERIVKGLW